MYILISFHDHKVPEGVAFPHHPVPFIKHAIFKPSIGDISFELHHLRTPHIEVFKSLFGVLAEGALSVLPIAKLPIVCIRIDQPVVEFEDESPPFRIYRMFFD